MRRIYLLPIAALLVLPSGAWAQSGCNGQFGALKFCGSIAGGLPGPVAIPAGGTTPINPGTVLGNPGAGPGTSLPTATTNPILGVSGSIVGSVGFRNATSGSVTIQPVTGALGSAVQLLPNASGTFAVSVSSPLALNALTGNLSITGAAGTVLAGSPAAFTFTPVLGVPGSSQGTLGLAGLTSGTATITAQATAGSPILTLPNTSGTLADGATSPLVLSATTGNLTCPTCVTSSGGGAITGTAPIAVSAAGVVSINAPYSTIASPISGGIPFFNSTTTMASSALLTNHALIVGGGAAVAPAALASLGTTTTVLHGNAAANPAFSAVVSADLNITTTTCTNQFLTAISATATGTCSTATLASAQFANQGTTTTLLHGNAAGNPSFGQVVSGDIASTVFATTANYLAGTSSTTLIPPNVIYTTETTTTFGATTTFDFQTFINTAVTLTGNITTQTLSNITAGKAGMITFIQDGTGSRTTVWNSNFKFAGGATPTLSTAPNAVDTLFFSCRSATFCEASLNKAFN